MCDTATCRACAPSKKPSIVGQMVIGVLEVLGVTLWWLLRRVVAPGLVAIGWCAYIWLTGAQWREAISYRYARPGVARRRLVRREVRAAGNWLLTLIVIGLIWQPVAVGIGLAIAGTGLVSSALAWRNRDRLRELAAGGFPALQRSPAEQRPPIRVQAIVGTPRRLCGGR